MSHLFDVLSDPPARAEAVEFLGKLKTAGNRMDLLKAMAKAGIATAGRNKPAIIGGAIGAALIGGAEYKLNKPGQSGESAAQRMIGGAVDAIGRSQEEARQTRKLTLPEDLLGASSRASKDFTGVFAKHPFAAGLSGAVVGGAAGAKYLAKLIKKVKP